MDKSINARLKKLEAATGDKTDREIIIFTSAADTPEQKAATARQLKAHAKQWGNRGKVINFLDDIPEGAQK
jgi:hypothetical protein